jgi:hypothetical protein
MVSDTEHMKEILRGRGFDIATKIDVRGTHNERSWARRFPAALRWFVGASKKPR